MPQNNPPTGRENHSEPVVKNAVRKKLPDGTKLRIVRRKSPGIPKIIRWIIVALLILTLIMVIWTNRANLTPSKISTWIQVHLLGREDGPGYPVTLTDSSVAFQNFLVEDGSPAVVSNTTFLHLSAGGKSLSLRQHGYTTPVMKRWGDNFLIYDLGNKSFRTSTDGQEFTEVAQYGYNIYCGAIAKNGSYAIASSADGYTSQLKVYDRNGLILFEWASQQYLISSVAFSPNSKYIVASGFASEGGSLKTVIHVFAFNKNQPLASHTLNDCIMLDVMFNDNNNVTAVGDTCAARFTVGKGLQVYDYQGLTLSAYDLTRSNGTLLALSASADGRVGSLVRLNDKFEARTVTRFEQALDSVQLYEDYVVTLSGGTLLLMNNEGSTVFYADAGTDAIKADCSKGVCYILGTGEIRTVDLKLSGD
jgi:WD40 repeat protein